MSAKTQVLAPQRPSNQTRGTPAERGEGGLRQPLLALVVAVALVAGALAGAVATGIRDGGRTLGYQIAVVDQMTSEPNGNVCFEGRLECVRPSLPEGKTLPKVGDRVCAGTLMVGPKGGVSSRYLVDVLDVSAC